MGYYSRHTLTILSVDNEKRDTILKEFRETEDYYNDEECFPSGTFEGDNFGSEIKGYALTDDLMKFSKKYPELTFVIGRVGEEFGDFYKTFVRNGFSEAFKGKIVFHEGLEDFERQYNESIEESKHYHTPSKN